MTVRGCEVLYGAERGRTMQGAIESATGQPCPCSQGRACPLMPEPATSRGALALATAAVLPVMAVAHAAAEAVQGLAVG